MSMHPAWNPLLTNLPPATQQRAARMFTLLVRYCVVAKESAMDVAMDMISIEANATGKYLSCIANTSNQMTCMEQLDTCAKQTEELKKGLVHELVQAGHELAPLELEAIRCALFAEIFKLQFHSVPENWPLPPSVLRIIATNYKD